MYSWDKQYRLGLIGYPLGHSFSKKYFTEKFVTQGIYDIEYDLFPLKSIKEFPTFIKKNPNIIGLNVTIPHKESVIEFLDEIDEEAREVGAVNTIIVSKKSLKGYNTDVIGFRKSLEGFLNVKPDRALILGTGGVSLAAQFVLKKMGIQSTMVSRDSEKGITYDDLDQQLVEGHELIVNCTPVGMHPLEENAPLIPYRFLSSNHYMYDMVYNPVKTLFLNRAEERHCHTLNGLEMLRIQAEESWRIWLKYHKDKLQ